jgi:hypothetical protein
MKTVVKREHYSWQCNTHRTKIAYKTDSFWSKSSMNFRQLLKLAFCWAHNFSNTTTMFLTGERYLDAPAVILMK